MARKNVNKMADAARELPVTETGLHQELEAVDRTIEMEEEERLQASRRHTATIKRMKLRKTAIMRNLEALRRGEMLPFGPTPDPDSETEAEASVTVE